MHSRLPQSAHLDADLGATLLQGLAGLEQEGHAVPARVVEEARDRRKRRRHAALGHCLVVEVAREGRRAGRLAVLPDDHVLELERLDRAHCLDLLVADVLRLQRRGGLHREERQDLRIGDVARVEEVAATAWLPTLNRAWMRWFWMTSRMMPYWSK